MANLAALYVQVIEVFTGFDIALWKQVMKHRNHKIFLIWFNTEGRLMHHRSSHLRKRLCDNLGLVQGSCFLSLLQL